MQISLLSADDVKKRIAAKTLLVFFIAVILLTFFANTIRNFTLPKVIVSNPQQGSLLKSVTGQGEMVAVDKKDIYYGGDINVKVEEIKVKQGDVVKKGDELIVFRKADIEKITVQDELLLGKLKLTYSQAEKAYKSGVGVLPYKRAVDMAKEQLEESKSKLEKVRGLYDEGLESQENLQLAQKSGKQAEKEYQYRLEDYNIAKTGKLEELKRLEYDLKMQEEKVKSLIKSIKCGNIIRSPYDGTVRNIDVSKGMWVNSSVKLCTVENSEMGYEFVADIDAKSADFVEVEDKAMIRLRSLEQDVLTGKVKEIKENAESKGMMKQVVINVSDDKVKGCKTGDVCIEKSTKIFEIIVPNTAVLPGNSLKDGYIRLLKKKEGFLGNEYYVEIVNVTVIDADNEYTAISGVISSDDIVVVKSDKPLYDQSRVGTVEERR